MFKKILLVAALLIPMLASAQTLKIGLVDQSEILSKMPETEAAQKQLADVSKKYEEEYGKLLEEMNRRFEEFKQMKPDELPAIKERKSRELEDYQTKVTQFEQNARQDLEKMNQELMAPIVQKIRSAIESVGKEGSYSLIQEKAQQIYFAAPVVDLTPEVKAKLGLK